MSESAGQQHFSGSDPQKYRVFISYSHEDSVIVNRIEERLKSINLTILRDSTLEPGKGFTEQIKTYISYAHVFIPILTPTSNARLWVHQEIGFATALNIPLIPISIGQAGARGKGLKVQYPEGMIERFQAELLSADLSDLETRLTRKLFENRIKERNASPPPYYCEMRPEQRAVMLSKLSAEVELIHGPDFVRQKGGLTTFGIPNKNINHPEWDRRYGSRPKSPHQKEVLLEERRALERHAAARGCRLIINPNLNFDGDPSKNYSDGYGPGTTVARQSVLLSFLESQPDDRCFVAVLGDHPPHNVTLVGDWFVAESLAGSMRRGVEQTLLTKHAPTVHERAIQFDQEFFDVMELNGIKDQKDSRRYAIERLKEIMRERGK